MPILNSTQELNNVEILIDQQLQNSLIRTYSLGTKISGLTRSHCRSWHYIRVYYLPVDSETIVSALDTRVKSVVQPVNRGMPNRAGGDTRCKDESSPKKSRIQLYKPPALKEKGTTPMLCVYLLMLEK